ncbi:VOC family protein [Cellulomonas sp. 179-A 9B4 NHS]|uniref:VOC family protein n=1 Tax=Cellulomonas sp. 179-A 9B4 NHS TaxID=3142379 RepID=UPI00399F54A6
MAALVPYLTVHDAAAAIDWYVAALGAAETGERYPNADGSIGFAALTVAGATFFVSDEAHEYGGYAPRTVGRSTVALVLEVADVDAVHARAVAAGATSDRPPADAGDERRGWFVDPLGQSWAVEQRVAAH